MTFLLRRAFWAAALERTVRTGAQCAAGLLVGQATGVIEADWTAVGSVSGMAAVVALLTCVGAGTVGAPGPSLLGTEVVVPAR